MTRLLVVDDEASVRKLVRRFFEARGYEVVVASNGLEGWMAVRDQQPDIVLTDITMPEMNGYELTRTIRRNPATAATPVIVLSAHREADAMVAGYECGADDYVAKPVDMELLRLKIDALLRRTAVAPRPLTPGLGKLICVTGAKGGVGVSTVTVNLAVLLSRRNETVCAYDLNLEHGDLPVLLDLQPKASVAEAVRDMERLGDGFQWDDYLVRHPSGARLLAAPFKPHEATSLGDDVLQVVTQQMRTLHDYVVADLPPTYGDVALSVWEGADRIVVITSPEITSLRRTRELLAVMQNLQIPDERVLLVLNRVLEVPGIDARRTEQFLRRPVAVTVPYGGAACIEAVVAGRPIVLGQPQSAVAMALTELAGML